VGTTLGLYAKSGPELYQGTVAITNDRATVTWSLVEKNCPVGTGEFQPLVFDSKRNRLLFLAADKDQQVSVYERGLPDGTWQKIPAEGRTKNSREVVYDPVNDCLISMPEQTLMVLHCSDNRWRELDVTMPKGSYGTECALVYDPVHRLCVALIPASFSGKLQVVLFRYDPKMAKYREKT
ncbi:MAG: hypothetical protein N2255_05635, partial [Kiritimatiellae bacterium]|nr:hypothetical protein [Kiritimatiellia bacterium]